MENFLEDVPCNKIKASDLEDPNRLKLDVRMLKKLREVQVKVQNYHKLERMKVTVKRKPNMSVASALTRTGATKPRPKTATTSSKSQTFASMPAPPKS